MQECSVAKNDQIVKSWFGSYAELPQPRTNKIGRHSYLKYSDETLKSIHVGEKLDAFEKQLWQRKPAFDIFLVQTIFVSVFCDHVSNFGTGFGKPDSAETSEI